MTENSTQKIRKIKPVDHPVGCLYSKPYEILGNQQLVDDSGNVEGSSPHQACVYQERKTALAERCQARSGLGGGFGVPRTLRFG